MECYYERKKKLLWADQGKSHALFGLRFRVLGCAVLVGMYLDKSSYVVLCPCKKYRLLICVLYVGPAESDSGF